MRLSFSRTGSFMLLTALTLTACSRDVDREAPAPPTASTPHAEPSDDVIPEDPSAVLITVNGKSLTRGEADRLVVRRMLALRDRISPSRVDEARRVLTAGAIEQFVNRTLLIEAADMADIAVSQEDEALALQTINQRLQAAGRTNTTAEALMASSPAGDDAMREELHTAILIEKLISRRLSNMTEVTRAEIDAFVAANREKLTVPESVKLSEIVIEAPDTMSEPERDQAHQKAEAMRNQLATGADFAELARQHSDSRSEAEGGALGVLITENMPSVYAAVVPTLEVGVDSPVLESAEGYHIVRIEERRAEQLVPDAYIKGELNRRKRDQVLKSYIEELKSSAVISYGRGVSPKSAPAP